MIKLDLRRSTYITEAVIRRIHRNFITKQGRKSKFTKILNI